MTVPRSDELLFAAGGEVWEKYGTLYKRTLPEEEGRQTFSRASSATFRDRSGFLRTAESGVVRPHWVSGESAYSVRLEASRTNNVTQSEDFSHADWTASNCTVSADADSDPEGGTTADNLSDTGASAHGFVSQAVTVSDDSSDDAASVYFEKKASDHIAMIGLEFSGGTGLTYECEINLNGGATDTSNSTDSPTRVVAVKEDNFWRVTVVGANNGTGNTTATVKAYPHVGTTLGTRDVSVTGDVDAWGAQLEDGAYPTSYVATTSAAVTRAADDASETIGFNPQALTAYGKVVLGRPSAPAGPGDDMLFRVSDAANPGNSFEASLFSDTLVTRHRSDGTTVETNNAPVGANVGDVLEFRCVLNSDGSVFSEFSVNGATGSTTSSSSTLALKASWSDETIYIGRNNLGNVVFGGADWLALTISSGVKTMDEMRSVEV